MGSRSGCVNPDLIPVLTHEWQLALDMWLVTHDGLPSDRRVMHLFDFLAIALTSYVS